MAPVSNCPRCSQKVSAHDRECPHCGVDLALAAILATEQLPDLPDLTARGAPMTPEILVPRLGEILIERKLISTEDLQQALDQHRDRAANMQPRLLGQVLLDLGMIDRETLDQVVTEQILQLQAALQRSNQQLEQRVRERTRDLQNALERLSELNQLKSNFISNISHELRTPLTHIRGYLDILADGTLGPVSTEQAAALDVLQRSERRLASLIEDLIRFSLASKGEFTLHKTAFAATELAAACLDRASKGAQARMLTLESRIEPGLPPVFADLEKITWVVMQLLDNAVKFTMAGGQVLLAVEGVGGGIRFSIIDTGIGIPAESIDEIFEPFHQLDAKETRRYGGTGLGLSLVKRILEAHGSLVRVDSQVGKGSCFSFVLQAVEK